MTDAVVDAAPIVDPAAKVAPTMSDAQAARLFKVKIDGNEQEVDEQELLRGYSHNKAASKMMQEAANERALATQVLQLFKDNPREAFSKLGVDAKKFAEDLLSEDMEETILTPEQKKIRDLERFKSEIEGRERTAREKQERDATEAAEKEFGDKLVADIVTSLQSADLPKNEFTVARMAFYLESCAKAGYPASPQDVVSHVKSEYENELKKFLGSVPDDKLLTFMGDDFTKKVVKAHIAKTGAKKRQPEVAKVGVKIEGAQADPDKPENLRAFFKRR